MFPTMACLQWLGGELTKSQGEVKLTTRPLLPQTLIMCATFLNGILLDSLPFPHPAPFH